jgi:hypothetical protein
MLDFTFAWSIRFYCWETIKSGCSVERQIKPPALFSHDVGFFIDTGFKRSIPGWAMLQGHQIRGFALYFLRLIFFAERTFE